MPMNLEKTLPIDRQRGGNAYVQIRSSAFYIRLGYLAGLGRSSVQIAEELGGEVNASYLRSALRRAGIAQVRDILPGASDQPAAVQAGLRGREGGRHA